jgi:acyl-[acyl carrier protein]--UDP-N-acetylglucosamine O-acyltransferase
MSNLRYLKHKILYSKLFKEVYLASVSWLDGIHVESISSFTNEGSFENLQFTVSSLNKEPKSITLAPLETFGRGALIKVENPKNVFFKIVAWLDKNIEFKPLFSSHIAKTAKVHKTAFISDEVYIGEGTVIGAGVVIYSNVKIGDNCIIEANSVLGNAGFGVVQEKSQNWMVPHVGGVVIGDNVRVGALTTIDRGTIGNTLVDEFSKIDDRVHIAHNCVIGKRNIICAGASVGGSVNIGNDCWLGLGCNISQKVNIGDSTTVGIGANVFHSTSSKTSLVGYPAKKMPS